MSKRTIVFDVETYSADLLYSMAPRDFVRLCGYVWGNSDEVRLTTDLEELKDAIRSADFIVGHNIHAFDLRAIFGIGSDEPLQMAMQRRVYDTWTHAVLVNPAPYKYVNRFGAEAIADEPKKMAKWFGLDEQAHQLGVPGKLFDLAELAKEFGDPSLPAKERENDGYGKIPLDDERYQAYLVGDVKASRFVGQALLKKGPLNDYAMREQEIAARAAIISSNGLRVDIPAATKRRDTLAARRDEILRDLEERYGLPSEGDAPWDTNDGKRAILAALADHGITEKTRPDWTKTPTWEKRSDKIAESKRKADDLERKVCDWVSELEAGDLPNRSLQARERWIRRAEDEITELRKNPLPPAFGLSLAGDVLIDLTEGTPAEELGRALAELKGQRSLSQLALDSVHPDGKVHPDITMLQRSGRWSTTKPGLTVWTKNEEKAYFIPDNDDEVLLEIDYSNADARMVAALSGDNKFAERFQKDEDGNDRDGHMINAIAAWGAGVVATDPKGYRQRAKAPGHGWGYRIGARKLSDTTGIPLDEAKQFLGNLNAEFSGVVRWQEASSREARGGYVMSEWGRKMYIESGREYTQGPALKGQNGTREIVCDALLSFSIPALRTVKAQIHDALLFSIPRSKFEACRDYLIEKMQTSFKPARGGQLIEFPVEAGPPGDNWFTASH